MPESPPTRSASRWALFAGFGGVAILMTFAGVSAINALGTVQAADAEIYESFLQRSFALERIRASVVLSGIYLRDYLVDPDPGAARQHLANVLRLREDVDQALASSSSGVPTADVTLRSSLADYWSVIAPALSWSPAERMILGPPFFNQRLIPQRARLLDIANTVAEMNELQLRRGREQAGDRFRSFSQRLLLIFGTALTVAALLALWTSHRILHLEAGVEARQRQLEALSASLVAAQEEERRAISRELHDEVGQSLSALLVELGNAAAVVPEENSEAGQRLESIRRLAETSVASVRNMALLLRPSMLDDLGLVPALHWQARETGRRTGLNVIVTAEAVPDDLPDNLKTCLYRLVQEALANAARHSGAQQVEVTVAPHAGRLRLIVHDNGKGFDPKTVRGLGLLGMEERVKHLHGAFRLDSAPGRGVTLEAELPLAAL